MDTAKRSIPLRRVLSAMILSGGIATLGYRRGALNSSGVAGAVGVGSATHLAGGWRWSSALLTFFASSSALSRLEHRSASGPAIAEMTERGARRDIVQVLANGGVASLAAVWQIARPGSRPTAAFAGAFAAANADTWATEIGGLSTMPPRLISSGRRVAAGTSGGVTPVGLAGAMTGSVVLGVVAGFMQRDQLSARYVATIALAGLGGSLVDSLVGATLQAGYLCPQCDKPTERRVHSCGTHTTLVRGWTWMSNDLVNVICTAVGAGIAGVLQRE